ncbi:MAG: hypothetical protein M3203_01035 [Actinomycetota bacterium]|nr:hypothetical protein [Actinomycetota bacterium]
MPRTPRWYDCLPEATASVTCGGEQHRVTWRRGKLVLEEHDLSAERGMLAFGGELCECMRVLEMWVEQFRMPPDQFLQLRKWLGPDADLAPSEFELHRRLGMILSWERTWRATFYLHRKQEKLLGDELKDKALGPLRQHLNAWKAKTGARVISGCQVAVVPGTKPATVEGTTDGVAMRAVAQLHGRWLVDVWPRGIAVVDDAFVVGLEEARHVDELLVQAVRWEQTRPGKWATVDRPARVQRDETGTWHLSWETA